MHPSVEGWVGGCNNKYDKYFYVYRKQISNSQRSGLAQLGSYEFHGRESYCFGYVFFYIDYILSKYLIITLVEKS